MESIVEINVQIFQLQKRNDASALFGTNSEDVDPAGVRVG